MTTERRHSLDPHDLSIRVRRGDSSAEERRALEQALSTSALLRVAHRVGRDFDQAAHVLPGDEDVIVRASNGAVAQRARRAGTRRIVVLGIAAALSVATAAAATGLWLSRGGAAGSSSPAQLDGASGERRPIPTPRPRAPEVSSPGSLSVEPLASAMTPPDPVTTSRGRPAGQVTPKTAGELFRDASAARRGGDFELARALYAELQTKYPASEEASVSRVSLGKLLLAKGRAREADQQFRSYLSSGRKNLEEEALVGRADALGRLGEKGEERRVWEALLRSHPSSVYAARARQRLDELGAADPVERP